MALPQETLERETSRIIKRLNESFGPVNRAVELEIKYALMEALDRGHDIAYVTFLKPYEEEEEMRWKNK